MIDPRATRTGTQVRLVLEKQCSDLGLEMAKRVPAGTGFVLVLADFGPAGTGNSAYLSTVDREDAIKLLEELIERLRGTS